MLMMPTYEYVNISFNFLQASFFFPTKIRIFFLPEEYSYDTRSR